MDASQLLALFAELTDELMAALAESADRRETGARSAEDNTQYAHDVLADGIVVPRLLAEGMGVLSEESGRQGSGDVVVVVDPIDGSTNAARGLPWYATSLCAVDEEGPLVGHVANLASGETFTAVRGQGAFGPDGRLVPSACTRLSDAVVVLAGPPEGPGGWAQFRCYGAAALDLCCVAAGRFDGYLDPLRAHAPWDYMAATLICREAGVKVVDLGGAPIGGLGDIDPALRLGPVAAPNWELLDELLTMAGTW